MYLLLILIPLFGAVGSGFGGNWIGPKGAVFFSRIITICSFIISITAFIEVGLLGSPFYLNVISWINSSLLQVKWELYFDRLTVSMLVVVTSVSSLVHLYGGSYIEMDPHRPRFMAYLSLFTFFILILVTAGNYLQLFVGWEGVGLCSYLLINFWFTRIQANKAAIKAMLVNRVGDLFLTLAILLIYSCWGSLRFSCIFSSVIMIENEEFFFNNTAMFSTLNVIVILLFLGAIGKSAQLFLHTWLPDAMEGPTPVSALIHAATMVTAGVFLLVRSSPLLEYADKSLSIITVLGASTAIIAATTGLVQNDLKRVIAYSTCSQLGYMIFSCGLSGYFLSMFHLANHAFFKALLFLGAGSIIHALTDEQDMRRIGGLVNILPFTYRMIFIGRLSLIGFPFLTGFYSKDFILEYAYASYSVYSHYAYVLGTVAAFFTAFYRVRLLYLTFLSKPSGFRNQIENRHEPALIITFPLFLLCWGAIFIGYVSKDFMVGVGTCFWGNSIFILPDNCLLFEAEFLPHWIKVTPVLFSLLGGSISFALYYFFTKEVFILKFSNNGRQIYTFFNRKWLFDLIYTRFITQPYISHRYRSTYEILDRGLFEIIGPVGVSYWTIQYSLFIQTYQRGHFVHYALSILWGVFLFIGILCLYSTIGNVFFGQFNRILVILVIMCVSFVKMKVKKRLRRDSIE